MRRSGVWLLLALAVWVAGCSSWFEPAGKSPQAECRREAYNDPKVKQLIVTSMGQPSANPQNQFDYEKALRDATNACLKKKGIAVQGGVEPVRPY
ncbi:MAG TPA: hypothetical protein VMU81_27780 [Acetobacteraceae bacterium]|jgi:hypothetical protein|nr:hypothetical protein [Acetobacteraceae bacterium]